MPKQKERIKKIIYLNRVKYSFFFGFEFCFMYTKTFKLTRQISTSSFGCNLRNNLLFHAHSRIVHWNFSALDAHFPNDIGHYNTFCQKPDKCRFYRIHPCSEHTTDQVGTQRKVLLRESNIFSNWFVLKFSFDLEVQ
jgi:hypothetical protein